MRTPRIVSHIPKAPWRAAAAAAAAAGLVAATALSAGSGTAVAASGPLPAGSVIVEGQLAGLPVLGGVRVALYAQPPQPVMARLHVGERFQGKLVGVATSSATGAYAIRDTNPSAITSSEYYGKVNLMIEAAGHGYFSFYGLPRKVVIVSGRMFLAALEGKSAMTPAHATLTMHAINVRAAAALSDVVLSDDCWLLNTNVGDHLDRIASVFSTINGVRKTIHYAQGASSSVSLAIDINGSGWVTGSAGTTSVIAGSLAQDYPEQTGQYDVTGQTDMTVGIFNTCQISTEIATFPYAWAGGDPYITASVPAAHYCVPETGSPSNPGDFKLLSTSAYTFADGIDLTAVKYDGVDIGISLGSTTGYTTETELVYQYTQNGTACGTHGDLGEDPRLVVADATMSGNS